MKHAWQTLLAAISRIPDWCWRAFWIAFLGYYCVKHSIDGGFMACLFGLLLGLHVDQWLNKRHSDAIIKTCDDYGRLCKQWSKMYDGLLTECANQRRDFLASAPAIEAVEAFCRREYGDEWADKRFPKKGGDQ